MRQARSSLLTALFGLFCSALASSTSTRVLYATFRATPEDAAALPTLLAIAAAGVAVHLFYLLSRVGQDKPMAWQRWIGEAALGGVTAYVSAALYYNYGPPTTPIGLSIAGVFGGFFGQRALVWIASTAAKLRGLPPPPSGPGGGTDGL